MQTTKRNLNGKNKYNNFIKKNMNYKEEYLKHNY